VAEIGFYHLTRTAAEAALPKLLARTLAANERAGVEAPDAARLEAVSAALWADDEWLPHGTPEVEPAWQPILLSTRAEPVNGAKFLFLLDGATAEASAYARVFDLFDGNDEAAVAAARARWAAAKDSGHSLAYWQQTEAGWQKQG
jgi:DNA polymerase-3 subunit chi